MRCATLRELTIAQRRTKGGVFECPAGRDMANRVIVIGLPDCMRVHSCLHQRVDQGHILRQ